MDNNITFGQQVTSGSKDCLYYLKLLLAYNAIKEEANPEKSCLIEPKDTQTGLLELLESQISVFDRLETTLKDARVTPEEAVEHFLRKLGQGLHTHLSRSLSLESTDVDFEFVFTVPAIWPNRAVDHTLQAARKAGLAPLLRTISEPEAAVHFMAYEKRDQNVLAAREICITVDAGGGTIDVIFCHIKMNGTDIELQEAVVGQSVYGGGATIDAGLLKLVAQGLGSEIGLLWNTNCETQVKDQLTSIKQIFSKDTDTRQKVYVGSQNVFLDVSDIREEFDVEFKSITKLLDEQIARLAQTGNTATKLFLAGGLCSNDYIQSCLRLQYPKLKVLQANDPQHAVACGAVRAGLDAHTMKSRKSKHNVGMHYRKVVDKPVKGTSHADLAEHDPVIGWTIPGISWFIKKGDNLPTKGMVHGYQVTFCPRYPLSMGQSLCFVTNQDDDLPETVEVAKVRGSKIDVLTANLSKYEVHCDFKGRSKATGSIDIQVYVRHDGARFHLELMIKGEPITFLTLRYPTLDQMDKMADAP